MNPRPRIALFLAILLLSSAGLRADEVDDLVRSQMAEHQIPGLSIAVVKDGKLLKAQGYGLANVELNVPATAETVYQIQSITKQFTATAIMILAQEGKLALDDPVSAHLEGTPDSWSGITIRHLLTHTSGIKDFINEPTASLRLDVTEEQVLQATAPRPLNFPPGERYAYSNTGYHLLAMIIRRHTGKPYGDFLNERIFQPLEMTSTRLISLGQIIPHRASGYLLKDGALHNGQFIAESILAYGGGGLRSTVLDLARWDAALYTDALLPQQTLQQMWTPATLNDGARTTYGFGWGISDLRGHRQLAHTGGHVTGFSTVIARYPDDRLTIVVLANLGRVDVAQLARRIAALYVPDLAPPT